MCIHIINISKENRTDRVNGSFKQCEQKQIFLLTALSKKNKVGLELWASMRVSRAGDWDGLINETDRTKTPSFFVFLVRPCQFDLNCYLRRDWRG